VFNGILGLMTRTVTLRLPEEHFLRIKSAAEADNRPISNFIHHATLRYLEHDSLCDPEEMAEILEDEELMRSLARGREDYRQGRYRVVRDRRDG
jgi:hypothetical protein